MTEPGEPAEPPIQTEPATIPALLLALSRADTLADQLRYRREHSPLRDDFVAATAAVRTWEEERSAMQSEIDALGVSIEQAEERGRELLAHRQRLEQQMKTVIAPREAEALMRELATIAEETDELDLRELEALESQSAIDDDLGSHAEGEGQLRDRLSIADDALAAERADIDTELATLDMQRTEYRSAVTPALLTTYDRKRAAFGVAVAPLVGKQCQGCHLDLSAAEVDTVRDEAANTGVTDCPNCGRLLIV